MVKHVTRHGGKLSPDRYFGGTQPNQTTDSPNHERKLNLLTMFDNTKMLLKPGETRVVVKGMKFDGYDDVIMNIDAHCEHNCAGMMADVVRNALTGKKEELLRYAPKAATEIEIAKPKPKPKSGPKVLRIVYK